MKSDLSLGDLKNKKSRKVLFDIEAPYETRTSLFYRL